MHRIFIAATLCFACTHEARPKTSADDSAPRSAPATTTPTPAAAPSAPSPAAAVTFDGLVDLGSVQLQLRCMGTGEPLVVFEAGLGLASPAWRLVQPAVARETSACAYDRAGRGLSGPAPYPHGQRQMAAELHALLQQVQRKGPYLLVGHSMGGAIVRYFLDAHPDTVAGMVLIDAATEDWPTKVLPRVPVEVHAEFWRNLRAWEGLDAGSYIAGYEQLRSLKTSLGSRPLVILTAGKPEAELPLRLEMQSALERLSSNTVHIVVKDSAHNIQLENPSRVIGSVLAVIHAARTRSRLSEAALNER